MTDRALTIVDHVEPWERQRSETQRAYWAYTQYRDMPSHSRTQAAVARRLQVSPTQVHKWAQRHNWVERTDAYDLYLDRRNRSAREQLQVEAAQQEHTMGLLMTGAVLERFEGGVITADDGTEVRVPGLNGLEIKAADLPRFAEAASRLQRLGLGMSLDVGGMLAVSPAEFQRIVSQLCASALERIPEDEKAEQVQEWREILGSVR